MKKDLTKRAQREESGGARNREHIAGGENLEESARDWANSWGGDGA